jgi:hypothetical protein
MCSTIPVVAGTSDHRSRCPSGRTLKRKEDDKHGKKESNQEEGRSEKEEEGDQKEEAIIFLLHRPLQGRKSPDHVGGF